MMNDFCIFILSHGRPDNVKTVKALEEAGYSGKWYIVIDNEDETADEYYNRYGDKVLMFDKKAESETFDTYDTVDNRKTIVYARNACFRLAKEVGVRYFMECDDDYKAFENRYLKDGRLKVRKLTGSDLDEACKSMIEFLKIPNVKTICFAQGGDFVGGLNSDMVKKTFRRKGMNSFFCDVEKPFKFVGRINEDVNTYTTLGARGELILTMNRVSLTQETTQKAKSGMSDVYLDGGTYLKSMYSVLSAPSCVKISMMGTGHRRIHHRIKWNNCAPMIIEERFKKA